MSAPAPTRTARPRKPPPGPSAILGVVSIVGITIFAVTWINFSLAPLYTNLTGGWVVIREALQPDWGYLRWWCPADDAGCNPTNRIRLWKALLETFNIAVLASMAGCVLAMGMSLLASSVSAPKPVVRVVKVFLSAVRSLPDIAYALIFVAAMSPGPLPGVLALTIFNMGIVAKLTSESIDAVNPGPIEAADAAGATRWQRARTAIVPQVLPNYLSYSLYVFELNIRASAVIGFVGAGGIGTIINLEFNRGNYDRLSAIVIVIFVVVVALDLTSQTLRKRLV
ncbi:phosphonate ABC transporter, permease protein PhnE [Nocardioides limicola]|uniref:phosphonate ABC transporter, permease protein PhnE n=1 Tax=Nocardioides limicola TaxID=2803368 RepID=UPI00193B28CD|nr:phosphonate ABC transporter, permease protein PhnE [Nocardioides sp. DJM-14]